MRILALICISILVSTLAMSAETTLVKATPEITYTNPAWSPSGKSIAFVGMACESPSIYLATLAGGAWKSKPLIQGADWPVWSPDGKRLAFNKGGLAVMDLAAGKSGVKVAGANYPLSWSPNGGYILYSNEGAAAIMDMKTGKSLPAGAESAWMADGKLLTSVSGDLLILDPATGKSRVVAKGVSAKRPFIPKGAGYAWAWITENAPRGEGIYSVDLKTGALAKKIAVRAQQIYWSPDGQRFAFLADWSPKAGAEIITCLYMGATRNWEFKVAAKGVGNEAPGRRSLGEVAWSPDSKSIAYVTAEGNISIIKL